MPMTYRKCGAASRNSRTLSAIPTSTRRRKNTASPDRLELHVQFDHLVRLGSRDARGGGADREVAGAPLKAYDRFRGEVKWLHSKRRLDMTHLYCVALA